MKQISVAVPGKLMLMGEHAVVYGRPCIVTAVDQRMRVSVGMRDDAIFTLEAPEVNITGYQKPMTEVGKGEIPKEARFAEVAAANFISQYKIDAGINITIQANFSAKFGFGSSSAVTVGVIKGLSELTGIKLSDKELFDLSYKTVLDAQGKSSGFDVAAAIYGGTIYFLTGGKTIEALPADGMNLVVGYSGIKADTVSMINLVAEKMKNYQDGVNKIFDGIGKLVDDAKQAMLEKDRMRRLGTLIDYNQSYLEDLGVSTDKLNNMITAAQKAGALGAKLSGAGGGDCMIALTSAENKLKVSQAIQDAGGEIMNVGINAPGARTENL